ncbi:MAG: hypothetical protein JSV09_06590 [Thermoplasmata archaeon]|nr:MAG: hypothetical protein JSV09_06590 [Thermoplasmata archaeon]
MIARITSKKEGYLDTDHDEVWQHVKKNYKEWRGNENPTLLYLTKRFAPGETSLIVDAPNAENFLEFLQDNILHLNTISRAYIFNLMKSAFFPIPKGTCSDLKRFTVTINAEPKKYMEIYNAISRIKPEKYFVVGYIAYTFQEPGSDIVVSILAKGISEAKAGVKKHIESLDGVLDTRITRITKTRRLYPSSYAKETSRMPSLEDESLVLDMF